MANEVTLRQVTAADLPRLVELLVEGFAGITIHGLLERDYGVRGERPWQDWKADEIRRFVERTPGQVVVAESDGKVVGFCSYTLDHTRKVGEIGNNSVDKAFQGRGIGAQLYGRVLELFREAGMDVAIVMTGQTEGFAPARRAYEKVGFRPLMSYVQYAQDLREGRE